MSDMALTWNGVLAARDASRLWPLGSALESLSFSAIVPSDRPRLPNVAVRGPKRRDWFTKLVLLVSAAAVAGVETSACIAAGAGGEGGASASAAPPNMVSSWMEKGAEGDEAGWL